MNMNTDAIIHSRRGQTLVEALIALSVLTVGFIGIVTLLNKSFELNRTTTNDTQATYLASEGIELAKNLIDYDAYYGFSTDIPGNPENIDWGCSFGLSPGQQGDYALDYTVAPPTDPSTSCYVPPKVGGAVATDHLYIDPSTHLYSYNVTGIATDFTRDVYITAVSSTPPQIPPQSYEFDVRSVVGWEDGLVSNTITLEDHFYNWYP
jgi:hypothetical protein